MNSTTTTPPSQIYEILIRETCPNCKGAKTLKGSFFWDVIICPMCGGAGYLTKWMPVDEFKKLEAQDEL